MPSNTVVLINSEILILWSYYFRDEEPLDWVRLSNGRSVSSRVGIWAKPTASIDHRADAKMRCELSRAMNVSRQPRRSQHAGNRVPSREDPVGTQVHRVAQVWLRHHARQVMQQP